MKHTDNLYLVDTGFHPLSKSSRSLPLVQSGSIQSNLRQSLDRNSVLIPPLPSQHPWFLHEYLLGNRINVGHDRPSFQFSQRYRLLVATESDGQSLS
jgi:hypothetical protein